MAVKKKIICYFVNEFWYFHLHWLDRAKAASENGYEVHVIGSDCGKGEVLEACGFTLHRISLKRGVRGIFYNLRTLVSVHFVLREVKPDILHCVTIYPNIIGGLINPRRKPIVFAITGLGWVFSSPLKSAKLLKLLAVFLYRIISFRSNCFFVFENSSDRLTFQKMGIANDSNSKVILGAGIDIGEFSHTNKARSEGPVRFLFASRLLKSKGLPSLLKASRILRDRCVPFELNVYGIEDLQSPDAIDDSDRKLLADSPCVNWYGQSDDISVIIKESDFVVLPTVYGEGVPRILIESISCGVQCIATDAPGCRDVVVDGETGFLLTGSDALEIANVMEFAVVNHDACREMKIHSRARAVELFDRDFVILETLQVYKRFFNE